jgi:predicted permease
LLLAAAGGVGAFLLSFWSAGLAAKALPYEFNTTFSPDLRVLLATFGVVVVTALFFTSVPAFRASQTRIAVVIQRGRLGDGRSRLREGLVVVQIALAVVLVAGAALFVRGLRAATSVDLGFAPENRLTISINLGQHGYSAEQARIFTQSASREIAGIPGVRRVSTAMQLPFRGMMRLATGAEGVPEEEQIEVGVNFVGPDYLETMGIPLIEGRDFAIDDRAGMPPVAVVNEAAASRLWPGGESLGRALDLMGQTPMVVGIAGNSHFHDLGEEPGPFVYLPILQTGGTTLSFIVETAAAPQSVRKPVEDVLRALDSRVALTDVRTIADIVDQVLGPYRVGATLVGLFSGVALILAAIGLYGTLSYLVVQRTRSIGIRMALGATSRRIGQALVARGLILAAIGIPIGMGAAWTSARLIQGFLFRVDARDPMSFLAVPLVIVATIWLASWLPARRAARLDPVATLREE